MAHTPGRYLRVDGVAGGKVAKRLGGKVSTAAELRDAVSALFDPALPDTEWPKRPGAWVAGLRDAWPSLTPEEREQVANMRSTLHTLGG